MKIKAAAQICAENKQIVLFNTGGAQWVSNGYAAYKLEGIPTVTGEELLIIFDVPEKEQEKYSLRAFSEERAVFEDVFPTERVLQTPKLRLILGGEEMLPLKTSLGLELINSKYLKPLNGMNIDLYEREEKDGVYIAAKAGLFCVAILMPNTEHGAILAETLEDIAKGWRQSVSRRECTTTADGQMQVDPETGEVTERP